MNFCEIPASTGASSLLLCTPGLLQSLAETEQPAIKPVMAASCDPEAINLHPGYEGKRDLFLLNVDLRSGTVWEWLVAVL